MITLRYAKPGDKAAWRRLWDGYTAFYEAEVPEAVSRSTWARALDPSSPLFIRVAEAAGAVVGFSASVLHEGTWSESPTCYLEDLFVDPDARRLGVGKRLIDDLIDLGSERGWAKLYWHTRADNAAARALYDAYGDADGFVRYRLSLSAG